MERIEVTIHTGDTLATVLEQLQSWATLDRRCPNIFVTIHAGVDAPVKKETK